MITGNITLTDEVRAQIASNSTIAGGFAGYTLPKATATKLGGIKVGNNLTIDSNGVLSATDSREIEGIVKSVNDTLPDDEGNVTITIPSIEGLATEQYVDTAIEGIEIPVVPTVVSAFINDAGYLTEHQNLDGYATETWVEGKGYLTEHQSLTGLATEGYVDTKISQIDIPVVPTQVSAFENDKGYLTEHQSLSGYATEGYVNTQISAIDIPTKVSQLENDKGYLTEHQSLEGLATESYVTSAISAIDIPVVPVNVSEFTNDAGYLTSEDIGTFATTEYVDNSISSLEQDIPTKVSQLENDSNYLTEHQSLSGYATESYVTTQIEGIDIPVVPTTVSSFTNDAGYLTEHQSLTAYALKTELPVVPSNVSAFTNDSGYLTSHQSLEGYATEGFVNSSIATNTANFIDTFNSVEELNAYSGTITNNDYAFVVTYEEGQVKQYDRYKYKTSDNAWHFEYTLNNSSFTQEQWNAINSGITSETIAGIRAEIPTVPTQVSAFTNDAGYLTSHQSLSGYATESYVTSAISGKSNTGHKHAMSDITSGVDQALTNSLLNKLSTGSDIPVDADYYIAQYVGGGTTTTSYHRRPISKVWDYCKNKGAIKSDNGTSYTVAKVTALPSSPDANTIYFIV